MVKRSFSHNSNPASRCLTVGIGIAGFPSDAQDVDRLLRRADQALYTAKKEGKNRVSCV